MQPHRPNHVECVAGEPEVDEEDAEALARLVDVVLEQLTPGGPDLCVRVESV